MTFIGEAIIGEFISKVSDSIVDISKAKIKEEVKNRKNKHQSLESQIYNIVVDVLNKITYDEYENDQDKIYDVAEKILKGFKSGIDNSEDNIKLGLNDICENVDENKCTEFKKLIYRELSKENYSELYREISLLEKEKEGNKTSRIERKVDVAIQKIDNIRDSSEKVVSQEEKFQNNKKDKYLKIWNSRLFLHIDNDESPLTLKDAFIMPDYNRRTQVKRIKLSDSDTMGDVIKKFVKYNKTSSMLITGDPGIGKTSITAWIANEYKDDEDVIILRFRDWDSEELDNGLLKVIYNTLKCKKEELENKILILDGFDEIKDMVNRDSLMNNFINDILDFDNFKIIVTSRPNYIDSHNFHNYFELLAFKIDKISEFYQIIRGFELEKYKIDCSNLNIIGIPVILYMALMSNIDLTLEYTKPELYSCIFAEVGGIFDKFCNEGIGYDKGNQVLRDRKNVKKYLKFLGKVAFIMFEKNDLQLNKGEYVIPELSFQGTSIQIMEFPIKYIFDNTEFTIEFIHKSLYEYFVSEYICFSICDVLDKYNSKENCAGILGRLLKDNVLTYEILEFLRFRIVNSKLEKKFEIIEESFHVMLQDGMTYYTCEILKNVIDCEMIIFKNMLDILHLWDKYNGYMYFDNSIIKYMNYNYKFSLNLTNVYFVGAKLNGIYLRGANLKGANLREADLRGANLENIDLDGAYLDYSIWSEEDFERMHNQIQQAHVRYIMVEKTDHLERIDMDRFFSDEKESDFL